MRNKFFNRKTNYGLIRNNSGFAFTAFAIVVAVLIGTVTLFLRNYITVNTVSTAKHHSSTQAFWSSMSGVDFILQNLAFDAGETDITYGFDPSSIRITTELPNLPLDPTDSTYLVTSTGIHGGHTRRLRLLMEPPSPFDNTFFDIDSTEHWDYDKGMDCDSPSFPKRYWGSSCIECIESETPFETPEYILDTLDLPLKYPDADPYDPTRICYWVGRKEQNSGGMGFDTIPDMTGYRNIELTLYLAAGLDIDGTVAEQSEFQTGDHFKIYANGMLIESWSPDSNPAPLVAHENPSVATLLPQFQEYTFNISNVLGPIDYLFLLFDGNGNTDDKYTGFAGVSLAYDMDWIIDAGSIQEW